VGHALFEQPALDCERQARLEETNDWQQQADFTFGKGKSHRLSFTHFIATAG
jgi:hypothetical protein